MVTATGAREPWPNTLPPSRRDRSPCVRWFPRRFSTQMLLNSSARHARTPESTWPSIHEPLVTKATTPCTPMRSEAQRIAIL